MTDEFGISINVNVAKGYFADTVRKSFNDDMNIIGLGGGIQLVGTTPETIDFDDIAYEGWLYLENVDTVAGNIVDYGPYDSVWLSSFWLAPGEGALIKLKPGTVIRAAFRTSEGRLLVKCYDSSTGT